MTKPYTAADLSNQLDRDLSWRIRELSDLKAAIRRADVVSRSVLLRALITLTYAHWEGYVRVCATKYFEHISLKKLSYDALHHQFYLNAFLLRLDGLSKSKVGLIEKCDLMNDILQSGSNRFAYLNPKLVDTRSNLNSDVIAEICIVCGLPSNTFEAEKVFIDILLLKRRNEVAHGEAAVVPEVQMDQIILTSIGLMRKFRNLLENNIYVASYLR